MSDMSDEQRAALRRVLSRHSGMSVTLTRDGEQTTITPRVGKSRVGTPIVVMNGGTSPREIERVFGEACSVLEQG